MLKSTSIILNASNKRGAYLCLTVFESGRQNFCVADDSDHEGANVTESEIADALLALYDAKKQKEEPTDDKP